MFSYIKGVLADKGEGFLVVDVNGIGFKVYTSLESLTEPSCIIDREITLYTYLYIKEGIMDLYGFINKAELDLFLLLISVSGVGAKGAISILSVAPCEKLCAAIATDDSATIKRASGIGAKTAQRVCLELKDKIKNESFIKDDTDAFSDFDSQPQTNAVSEAISALISLGYTATEAQRAVSGVKGEDAQDVSDIIKYALKNLM